MAPLETTTIGAFLSPSMFPFEIGLICLVKLEE